MEKLCINKIKAVALQILLLTFSFVLGCSKPEHNEPKPPDISDFQTTSGAPDIMSQKDKEREEYKAEFERQISEYKQVRNNESDYVGKTIQWKVYLSTVYGDKVNGYLY